MKRLLTLLLCLLPIALWAQTPVQWAAKVLPQDARAGEGAQVVVTATLEKGWHIYALDQPKEFTSTSFKLSGSGMTLDGDPVAPYGVGKQDPTVKKTYEEFSGAVAFGLPVRIAKSGPYAATVEVRYQACDAKGCLPPTTTTVMVPFTPAAGAARTDRLESITDTPEQPEGYIDPDKLLPDASEATQKGAAAPGGVNTADYESFKNSDLGTFLLLAFASGLLALLTPCVFPMIPVTVAYFSKRQSKSKYGGPLAYLGGMVFTFTGLGMVLGLLGKAADLTRFATHPITNALLGVLFIVLAFSLFGVFDFQLPSSWVGAASKGRTKGGLLGPFMMGLTFSMTSFTCTIAFVGTLLAAAATGEFFKPALGMLVFSLTFGLPFFLLALFPGFLNKLPRAGAWMNTTKAAMGFLELVAAFKFLQNADIVWKAGILTKGVFLSVWSSLFILGGLFLLGWMVLPKLAGEPIGWLRRVFGVAFVGVGIWLLSGLAGKSLGDINAFLPPEPYPFRGQTPTHGAEELSWVDDYDAALIQAKKENKRVFVDFTGWTCQNCRWMESNMFPKPAVKAELEKMVRARLYTDGEDAKEKANLERVNRIGKSIAMPLYLIVSPDGEILAKRPFTPSEEEFVAFLKTGS